MPAAEGSRRQKAGGKKRRRPRVEVRETRYGRELIVDDTFASFQRGDDVATGSVWDALAVPLLALPSERLRRVLVLGFGGGSVARLARALLPKARIVGVEFDGEVIEAARSAFGIDELGVELVHADAQQFLRAGRGRFDAIIEDVFIGRGDAVHKPAWLPEPGLDAIGRRLAPGGLVISNTIDETAFVAASLARRFPSVVGIGVESYDNCVLAASEHALSVRSLRAAIRANAILAPTLKELRLRTLKAPK